MGEEELPKLEASGYTPGRLVLVAPSNAVRVFVTVAVVDVGN